jgi:hypothetical protein
MSRLILLWTLLAAITALFLLRTVIPASGRLTNGFLGCYVGGQIVKEGGPGDRLYDRDWMLARTSQVSAGQDRDVFLPNPPAFAVACLPLAHMSVASARKLWIWLSALFLGLAIGLVTIKLSDSLRLLPFTAIAALFTLSTPARDQFFLGQSYAFLLLLHVVTWRAYTERRDGLAGLGLGLAMVLKLSGWPIGLLMIAQRRWKALGWSVMTAIALALLTVPWVGLGAWRTLVTFAIPLALRWPEATLTAYQDTTGFWQHWLRYDPEFNPSPIVDAPLLATLLTLTTTIIACIALVVRRGPTYLRFGAAVALIELLSPAAEQYHYTLLLLPLAILWHEAFGDRSMLRLSAACLGTVLIGWPIHYKLPHPTWEFLLSYPRLLGGWIVFAALLTTWRDADQLPVSGSVPSAPALHWGQARARSTEMSRSSSLRNPGPHRGC